MAAGWVNKRVLITVRTYPAPARKGAETSCTAAITDSGEWVRIFPVPYRSLPKDRKFSKYQWIEAALKKATGDARPESHNLNIETIKLGTILSTKKEWAERKAILRPLMRPSLCAIQKERNEKGHPTLAIFRPGKIKRLVIKPTASEWTPAQKAILSQKTMGFLNTPKDELEKIPFDFYYEFICAEPACRGHKVSCTDWEMAESYRRWRKEYGPDKWEAKIREKYEHYMIEKCDLHFYVGTIHKHPKNWLIVGLFYPLKAKEPGLFD